MSTDLSDNFLLVLDQKLQTVIIIFMLSSTITESVEAHQRSFDRGVQIGHQRRNKVGPLLPFYVTSVLLSVKIKRQNNSVFVNTSIC